MRFIFWLVVCVCCLTNVGVAKSLDFYFDPEVKFDSTIPTPESVLGYQVGQWHVRPDQITRYMTLLAEKSDRINIQIIGYSHEQQPLLMLTISAPNKLKSINAIQQQHLARINGGSTGPDSPVVVWMGYSVHGNESSGSNAALLVAYYLAAAQGEKIETLLNNAVILLDPSLNPDGLARFAQWANMHKGTVLNPDPNHKEHNENWPSGRSNHYWADLNRDWLLLQHPESRARVAQFHQWKPNIVTDFHEMGSHGTFFFQPGIPSRKHPLTPEENVTLTQDIAQFHAKAFDVQKSLYFTEESFDDFYYGKGSTYPDINGSVGILFEQASSRGHQQTTINGLLEFPQTIKNQVTTSLSTIDAAIANKDKLLAYQRKFYQSALKEAQSDKFNGYIVHEAHDKTRMAAFLSILKQHQIVAYPLTKEFKTEKVAFSASNSYYIPFNQAQYRLIKAIFSEQKTFADNTFYDVSGWTLAHAFNFEFIQVGTKKGLKFASLPWHELQPQVPALVADKYAYAFEWHDYLAPKLLNQLLNQGVEARVSLSDFSAVTNTGERAFTKGSIVIPAGVQQNEDWFDHLTQLSANYAIDIFAIESGLTPQGIDLGSRKLAKLNPVKVLLLGGNGTNSTEVGEVWHYLDRHVGLAPTIIDLAKLGGVDFSAYSHIILADGQYQQVTDGVKVTLRRWVKKGGVIWGHKGGAKFLVDSQLLNTRYTSSKEMAENFSTEGLLYQDKETLAGQKRIAGAIFNTQIDLSHPLSFSLSRSSLAMFKNSTFLLEPIKAPFVNIAHYQSAPLLAGFSDERNVTQIAGGLAFVAHNYGQGRVIAMTDNPVFRGYWYGTSRLLSNALFFSHTFSANAE